MWTNEFRLYWLVMAPFIKKDKRLRKKGHGLLKKIKMIHSCRIMLIIIPKTATKGGNKRFTSGATINLFQELGPACMLHKSHFHSSKLEKKSPTFLHTSLLLFKLISLASFWSSCREISHKYKKKRAEKGKQLLRLQKLKSVPLKALKQKVL